MLTSSNEYGAAICKAMGVDPNKVSRVVVDAKEGEPLRVYMEMFGGHELVTVNLPTGDIEIAITGASANVAPEPSRRVYFGQHQSEVPIESQEQR